MDQGRPPPAQPPVSNIPPAPPPAGAPSVPDAPAPSAGNHGVRVAAIVVGVVAILAIAGGVGAFFLLRGSSEQLLGKIPEGTDVVATAYLDPSAGQKVNLLRMADALPALGSREELTDRLGDAIDEMLSGTGLDRDDVGWVGSQVAVAVDVPARGAGEPAFTLLLAAGDDDEARATLDRLRQQPSDGSWTSEERRGVDVWTHTIGDGVEQAFTISGGTVLLSTSVEAIDGVLATAAGERPAVEDSADFEASMAGLPDDKLGLLFVDPTDLVRRIQGVPGVAPATAASGLGDLQMYRALALSVAAEPDGLAVDVEVTYDPEKMSDEMRASLEDPGSENSLLADVPADSLLVIDQENVDAGLGDTVEQLRSASPEIARELDRLGITSPGGLVDSLTGEVALEGAPSDEVGATGALLLGTDDAAAMERALGALGDELAPLASGAAASASPRWVTEDHHGVSIHTLEGPTTLSPFRPTYAVIDGAGVIGLNPEAVRAVIDTQQGGGSISDSPGYTDAIAHVPSGSGIVFVDVDGIGDAVRGTLPPDALDEYDREVGPTVEHIDAFVVGSEASIEHQHVRLFVRVT